jgi:hypothetical protein
VAVCVWQNEDSIQAATNMCLCFLADVDHHATVHSRLDPLWGGALTSTGLHLSQAVHGQQRL